MTPENRVLELYRTGPKEDLKIVLRALIENGRLHWFPNDKYKLRMNVQNALIRSAIVVKNIQQLLLLI